MTTAVIIQLIRFHALGTSRPSILNKDWSENDHCFELEEKESCRMKVAAVERTLARVKPNIHADVTAKKAGCLTIGPSVELSRNSHALPSADACGTVVFVASVRALFSEAVPASALAD